MNVYFISRNFFMVLVLGLVNKNPVKSVKIGNCLVLINLLKLFVYLLIFLLNIF